MNKLALKTKSESGLLTIEASVILPLFLVLIIVILSFVNIVTTQMRVQTALDAAAKEVSQSAYINNLVVGDQAFKIVQNAEEVYSQFHGENKGEGTEEALPDLQSDQALYEHLAKIQDSPRILITQAQYYLITSHRSESENSFQVGEALAKVAIQKHLANKVIKDVNARENNVDQVLKKGGVEDGFQGLDFTGSKAFVTEGKPKETQLDADALATLKSRISGNINNQWMTFLVMHDNSLITEQPSCKHNQPVAPSNANNAKNCLLSIDGVSNVNCKLTRPNAAIHADCTGNTIPTTGSGSSNQCVYYLLPHDWECSFSDSNFFYRDQKYVNNFINDTIDKFTTHAPQDERLICEGGKIKTKGTLHGTNAQLRFITMVKHSSYRTVDSNDSSIDQHGNVGQNAFALDGNFKTDKTPVKFVDDGICPADNQVKIDNVIDFRVSYTLTPFDFFGLKFGFPVYARATTNAWSDPIISDYAESKDN